MAVSRQKDKDSTLDYQFSWGDWLVDDTIIASSWVVPAGLTNSGSSFDDNNTVIWLSGGVLGEVYEVVNRITTLGTTQNRVEDRTLTIAIVEK